MKKMTAFLIFSFWILIFAFLTGCGQTVSITAPGTGNGTAADVQAPSFEGISSASAGAATNEVTVSWNAATDESSVTYYIYRSTAETLVFSSTAVATSGVTSYKVGSLAPDTAYFFGVRASDEAGNYETNTVATLAVTARMSNGMKQFYNHPLLMPTSGFHLLGVKGFLAPNTDGTLSKSRDIWNFAFSNGSTLEVWQTSLNGVTKEAVGSNLYNDVANSFSITHYISEPPTGLDSYAAMQIVKADATVQNWLTNNSAYYTNGLTILARGGDTDPVWIVSFDANSNGQTLLMVTLNAQTGVVFEYQ